MSTVPVRRPAAPIDPARQVAYDAIREVTGRDAYANLVLPALLGARGLGPRDAALATELTYGTLRRLGTYDAVLGACVDRPLDALDPRVLDVLRLGAHQLLGTRIARHAAVDQSVRLVRRVAGVAPSGLVNAVLRAVAKRGFDGWLEALAPDRTADPIGYLSLAHAHPRWVVEAFADALGHDATELERALAADNERPAVTLVARPGRCAVDELFALGARAGRWSPLAAVLPAGAPGALAPIRDGRAGVQDEGSQVVALALANAPLEGPDRRWLDLCAGPGGKAALLAGLGAPRGARLAAADLHPHRAELVRSAVGAGAGVLVADATTPAWRAGAFDRVLLDAPCTGLGALRRRPESRWRRTPGDVESLRALQARLLLGALDSVRPGGFVAYVTCSPHPAETRAVVEGALVRGGAELVDVRPSLPPALAAEVGSGPDVQLWPHRHGTDAMYLALLRRG